MQTSAVNTQQLEQQKRRQLLQKQQKERIRQQKQGDGIGSYYRSNKRGVKKVAKGVVQGATMAATGGTATLAKIGGKAVLGAAAKKTAARGMVARSAGVPRGAGIRSMMPIERIGMSGVGSSGTITRAPIPGEQAGYQEQEEEEQDTSVVDRAREVRRKIQQTKKKADQLKKVQRLKKLKRLKNLGRTFRAVNAGSAASVVGIIVTFVLMNLQMIFGNWMKSNNIPPLSFGELFIIIFIDFLLLAAIIQACAPIAIMAKIFEDPVEAVLLYGKFIWDLVNLAPGLLF